MDSIEIILILLGAFCFVALVFKYENNDDEWPNPTG